VFVQLEVPGAHRRAVQLEQPTPFGDAIDDGLRKIGIVEHAARFLGRFIGREHQRALAQMALVDDVEEDVGGIGNIGEVSELVDHEHARLRVRRKHLRQAALPRRGRELLEEGGRGREQGIEPVLNRARYAIATARCVFSRPVFPVRITQKPSVTTSAER
jgi:hypothetical protein